MTLSVEASVERTSLVTMLLYLPPMEGQGDGPRVKTGALWLAKALKQSAMR